MVCRRHFFSAILLFGRHSRIGIISVRSLCLYISLYISLIIVFICPVACCAARDIAFEPFFKEVETFRKNEGSKREKNHVANKCIADALNGMEEWIGKGN